EDEELVGPRLAPCLFPLGVRLESVLCQMKLGVEQLLRAEAQGNLAGFALRFPLLQTVFETSQTPPLLMKLMEPGRCLLSLLTTFLALPILVRKCSICTGSSFRMAPSLPL